MADEQQAERDEELGTPAQQITFLQSEIGAALSKLGILNDLFYGLAADDVTTEDVRKLLVLAESVRGLTHYAERVAMKQSTDVDEPATTKKADDLVDGDLIVYHSALLGPQNLRVLKMLGTTTSGHLLLETESVGLLHEQLPPDMRFLELPRDFLVESVDAPVNTHTADPDIHAIGSRYSDQSTELSDNHEFWERGAAETGRGPSREEPEMHSSEPPGPPARPDREKDTQAVLEAFCSRGGPPPPPKRLLSGFGSPAAVPAKTKTSVAQPKTVLTQPGKARHQQPASQTPAAPKQKERPTRNEQNQVPKGGRSKQGRTTWK